MTEASRPFDGTIVGDSGPYGSEDWREIWRNVLGWGGERANVGVFLGSGTQPNDGLLVQAQSPASTSIEVQRGAALVRGIFYLNTATVTFVVANNASGNPRIDTVVLRADYIAQTVRLALKQGAPAVSPTPPALTQTIGVLYEIPIADVAVADGFTSISNANITSRREWINAPPGVYLDSVLNNSGVTLEDGDVVVWDNSVDRAVTTTTALNNRLLAGVWRGRVAAGGYGRVQTQGIGYVRVSAAVTRGDTLVTSATVRAAVSATRSSASIGHALATLGAAGLVLAQIRIQRSSAVPFAILEDQKATNTAGGGMVATTWTTRDLNTEVVDANGIVSIAANAFTPIAGVYRIYVTSSFVGNNAASTLARIRMRNVTAASVEVVSANHAMGAANQGINITLEHSFIANGTDAYDIQYFSTQARATNGLGLPVNEASAVERYTQIYLEKVA